MTTPVDLQIQDERMKSIALDLESQNEIPEEKDDMPPIKNDLQIPLKGILKKPSEDKDDINFESTCIKFCLCLFMIVFVLPITFCDLYFGFTDNSCSKDEPDGLAISLKLYLLVSGFTSASILVLFIMTLICYPNFSELKDINDDSKIISCTLITFVKLFILIWNILGAVVFWGYLYGSNQCNKQFSIYMFVSLIIKFISIIFESKKSNKK
jgi:hypothetical protein